MNETEDAVVAGLVNAQTKANELFKAVETQNLIRPGYTETEIAQKFGQPLGKVRTELRAAMGFLRHRLRAVMGTWVANI